MSPADSSPPAPSPAPGHSPPLFHPGSARRWRRALLLVIAVTLVALAWWTGKGRGQTVRLADGRSVTLKRISYGTSHLHTDGPLWAELLERLRPYLGGRPLPVVTYREGSPSPSLMIWTEWQLPPSQDSAPLFLSAVDESGMESEPVYAVVNAPRMGGRGALIAWKLENYPRSSSTLRLRFYQRDRLYEPHLEGEVQIPNPRRFSGSAATPPLPQPVPVNGRTFTLLTLTTGAPLGAPLTNRSVPLAPWTQATFAIEEPGPRGSNWTVRAVEGWGASGNHFSALQPLVLADLASVRLAFPEPLWPEETSWRLQVEFVRRQGFADDALIPLPPLPLLPERAAFTTNVHASAQTVLLSEVTLRGITQLRPWTRGNYRPNCEVVVRFSSRATHRVHLSLARVVDDQGREVRFGHETGDGAGRYEAALEVPPAATQLQLTFAAQTGVWVEFHALPRQEAPRR